MVRNSEHMAPVTNHCCDWVTCYPSHGNMNRSTTILIFDLSRRCTSPRCFIDSVPSRVSRLNNERPSFASRFIIEKPLSAIHVSLKTRQTRRSTRSLPPASRLYLRLHHRTANTRRVISNSLVIYERNLELCYFNALCSKLDGALRSQKRLGTSQDGKVSCLKSQVDLFPLFPSL